MDVPLSIENGEPSEAMTRSDRVINKSILTIAPGTEHHSVFRISVDNAMRPTRRNDYFVAADSR